MNFVKSSLMTVKAFSAIKSAFVLGSAAMSLCSVGFAGALFAKHISSELGGKNIG